MQRVQSELKLLINVFLPDFLSWNFLRPFWLIPFHPTNWLAALSQLTVRMLFLQTNRGVLKVLISVLDTKTSLRSTDILPYPLLWDRLHKTSKYCLKFSRGFRQDTLKLNETLFFSETWLCQKNSSRNFSFHIIWPLSCLLQYFFNSCKHHNYEDERLPSDSPHSSF